jgi:hypothetical protein
MSASKRAQADIAAGDLGSARRRLESALSQHFDPDACELLARVCADMQDPSVAGRWYFLIDSQDPRAASCIDAFVRSTGSDGASIHHHLPSIARSGRNIAAAERRIVAMGGRPFSPRGKDHADSAAEWRDTALGYGCLAGTLALLALALVGLVTVVRWLARLAW